MHVPELRRMGAKISIQNNEATVEGPVNLSGAEVMATDLRASVSLVLAALSAENQTIINRVYHLDRGYEHLEKKLKNCKANIKRV
jgi:UDP-N-acetylglucosamine 1-carboxyvinyltransferase